jgi:hypothetical protein
MYFTEDAVRQHFPWRFLARAIESKVNQPNVVAPRRLSFELGAPEGRQSGRLLIMPSWNAETMAGIKTPVPMPVLVTTYSLSRNDGDVLLRLALTRTDSLPQTDADTSARCCPPYNKMPQTLRPQSRIATPCVFNSTPPSKPRR